MHCFGHIHEGYGAEIVGWDELGKVCHTQAVQEDSKEKRYNTIDMRQIIGGSETLMVNAAIRGKNGESCNRPWVVHLPCTGEYDR